MQEIKTISTYKQSLREKILMMAMRSFAENGIRAVRMDDIAARLSISKRTLYEIYENKEDLLFEGVKAYNEQVEQRMQEIGSKCANVMEIVLKVYRMKIEEYRMTSPKFYYDIVKYPRILAYLDGRRELLREKQLLFLERGVREGYFRNDVNFELIGQFFDALGNHFINQRLYQKYTMEELFDSLVFVIFRGFCTEKGFKALEELRSHSV
ncbi:MAG: TetR/AcrR family transcriptional regulator [Prevotella sp.]|nr:TetR/AcrR family transcriptional regulator [Prevotella sp.]